MADFHEIIKTRRSIRKFTSQPVESSKVEQLLEAGLRAPSGRATYPTEFIVVSNSEIREKLAKVKAYGGEFIAQAPLAIVIVGDTSKYDLWVEDACIASTFVMLEAENCGLGCCWVQMHLRGTADGKSATENIRPLLNLPESYEVLSILAIGYKAEHKAPHADSELNRNKIHFEQF